MSEWTCNSCGQQFRGPDFAECPKCKEASELPSSTGSGIRVKFQHVGGGKMCWETTLPDLEYRTLLAEIRKRGALCSLHPDFAVDDDGTGTIFAGFRCVGTFEWQNDKAH